MKSNKGAARPELQGILGWSGRHPPGRSLEDLLCRIHLATVQNDLHAESPDSSSLPESIRLLQLVWMLKAALDRTSLDMESKLGVTGLQRFLLRFVGLAPGITREGLAQALSTEAEIVQRDLEKLVAANLLVEHRGAPGYYLTGSGASINAAMAGTIEEAMIRATDESSAYERTSFRKLLERVTEHLGSSRRIL